jgi:hypothetical protein
VSANCRRLLAAAVVPAAVAAVMLAGSAAAGASTGPRYASAEQVGYAATGAQFGHVSASVYLRNPARYAGAVGQYSQSVQLWSSDLVAVLGASASTSGASYTPYVKIYDASSHQLLASDPNAFWCDNQGDCSPTIGTFPAGHTVTFSVTYNRQVGSLYFAAVDTTYPGWALGGGYTTGTRESFTQARVGTEFGSDPWTAPASFTHPAAWTKIAVFNHVELDTYNGRIWTLASWFVHHKIFMVGVTGSLIDVEAAPTDLSNSGASFQDWLAPAGVNGPAQPPRG